MWWTWVCGPACMLLGGVCSAVRLHGSQAVAEPTTGCNTSTHMVLPRPTCFPSPAPPSFAYSVPHSHHPLTQVSVSDILTLFSACTHETYFWGRRPGKILMGAVSFSLLLSTILAMVWPDGRTDGIPIMGLVHGDHKAWFVWVWIYCIVWWIIQDTLKVLMQQGCCSAQALRADFA